MTIDDIYNYQETVFLSLLKFYILKISFYIGQNDERLSK